MIKESVAIVAAAAAVVGVAAAAKSKKDQEAQTQALLNQEMSEKENRNREEELTKQKEEEKRLAEENARKEWETKLARAPKYPVYKPAPLTCPYCGALGRSVLRNKGLIVCSYCDRKDQLIIDHWEIDKVAFQRQLQAERQAKKATELAAQKPIINRLPEYSQQQPVKQTNATGGIGCLGVIVISIGVSFCLLLLSAFLNAVQ